MNTGYTRRSITQIAQRIVQDIPDGAYVNLGIGQPMIIANHLPDDKEIIIQSENGILGMGPVASGDEIDPELVNAGKQNVTLLKGGAIFHHGDSFGMIRGGHIDICVLGAFQVSATGDLANWRTLDRDAIPGVGGAMDLAKGAKRVFVMMEHLSKSGESKLVEQCTYPRSGRHGLHRSGNPAGHAARLFRRRSGGWPLSCRTRIAFKHQALGNAG